VLNLDIFKIVYYCKYLTFNNHIKLGNSYRVTISNMVENSPNKTITNTLTINPVIQQDTGWNVCEVSIHHNLVTSDISYLLKYEM